MHRSMVDPRAALQAHIHEELSLPCHPAAHALADALRERHGEAVLAILFYGSCLRERPDDADAPNGLMDFYVLVDSYAATYRNPLLAVANAILPPNVFYAQIPWQQTVVRAKYAVISLSQFRYRTSHACLNPSTWARFSQRAALLYSHDETTRRRVDRAVTNAVVTMAMSVAALIDGPFEPAMLWQRALDETYRAELRPEREGRSLEIYRADQKRFDRLAPLALAVGAGRSIPTDLAGRLVPSISRAARRRARRLWRLRHLIGKPLNILRLMKSVFTFQGGVEYAVWKVERHTGVRVELSGFERRHPILASPGLLWRLMRMNAVR